MRARPILNTLNDIRAKLPRHAEAFDQLIQAIGNLPSISGPVKLIGSGTSYRFPNGQIPAPQSVHVFVLSGGSYVLQIGGYQVNGNRITFTSAPATPYASYAY